MRIPTMTRNRTLLLAALLATGVLAGCDKEGRSPPPPETGAPLSELVQDLFASTSETGLPVDINALEPDPSDETPTLYDNLLI